MPKAPKNPTSLTMGQAMKTYLVMGGIVVFTIGVFFFLAAQTTRQISDWW